MLSSSSIPIFHSFAIAGSAAALLINAWLYRNTTSTKTLPGCGRNSPCDAVLRSRWSKLGPIPVAALGAILCLAQLLLASAAIARFIPGPSETLQHAAVTIALIILGAGLWFLFLQIFIVRRLCLYCIASHLSAMTASACILSPIAVWDSPKTFPGSSIDASIAALSLTALILGQILVKPRTFAVVTTARGDNAVSAPAAPHDAAPAQIARAISLSSGRIKFHPAQFPLLGSPDAQHVIGCLLDYTCHECHPLHQRLFQLVDHYAGRLAIACIPTPLNPRCNPIITKPRDEHVNACAYARLALALWITTPSSYPEWDRYILEEIPSRPLGSAIEKAHELAETAGSDLSAADPIVDQRIAAAAEIYRLAEGPDLPTLLLPHGMLLGRVPDLQTLINQIDRYVINSKTSPPPNQSPA